MGAGSSISSGEDIEYLARVSWSGWKGGYFPEPVVWHNHGSRDPTEIEKLNAGYDLGRGAYYTSLIFKQDSRKLYSKHWWWSIDLKTKQGRGRFYREILGMVKYLYAFFKNKINIM